ncbi:MAG: bifunctional DNA-formamidopyrimidine glycosylase/DNA-(apurinic or apyrimidinic site) lyase [Mariprofundaceae bacterium]
MPELPEVEVVRQGLSPRLIGQYLQDISIHNPSLRYPVPPILNNIMSGHQLMDIHRRGKYLLFEFDHEHLLAWHMGMSGQFHVLPASAPTAKHEHLRLNFSETVTLRYRDPRRFGYVGVLEKSDWQQHPWFINMGPEPLSDDFHHDHLHEICTLKGASIKSLIMNAHIVVGVGNIYASESLFRTGIHPSIPGKSLAKEQYQHLTSHIRQTLQDAIDAGGSSISDFVQVDGKPGYFSHNFQVYGRSGDPCYRCRSTIEQCKLGGRSTFYCPSCQPI